MNVKHATINHLDTRILLYFENNTMEVRTYAPNKEGQQKEWC